MKESINFYYNFNISEIENWGEIYRFKIYSDNFYFVPLKRSESEIEDIINVSREMKNKGIEVHDIILNKFNKVITNVYNKNYILLKPYKDIYEEYDITDMNKINKKLVLNTTKSKLYRNSWANLWSQKIDYFEYQIHELGKNKKIILNSFSYFIGLAENAISYVNSTHDKYKPAEKDKISLSHRRINYPNYKLNYLNPVNFIFDLEIRDIAEYIKSSFFNGEDALNELKVALRLSDYSVYSLQLLYARLLYPCYYFDLYEKIMNEEETEESLIPILEKIEDYEKFLKQAFYEINKYAPIERIEWILK